MSKTGRPVRAGIWLAVAFLCGCGLVRQKTVWKSAKHAPPSRTAAHEPALRTAESDAVGSAVDADVRLPPSDRLAERALAAAEAEYAAAVRADRHGTLDCVHRYYRAAGFAFIRRQCTPDERQTPDWLRADAIYSSAVARLIEAGQRSGMLDPRFGLTMPNADGQDFIPIVHRVTPWRADDIDELIVVGRYKNPALRETFGNDGIGVPLVGIRNDRPDEPNKWRFLAKRHPITLTALVVPDARLLGELDPAAASATAPPAWQSGLLLINATRFTHFGMAGQTEALCRDLTAPLAYPLEREQRIDLAWFGFRQPELAEEYGGIFLLEPFQPGKIPVILVHGLLSSPTTWSDAINGLRANETIRKHFQLAVYRYPTGLPFVVSAARFRQDLDEFHRTVDPENGDAALNRMVLVGHSMGGLLVRLQVAASGNAFWRMISDDAPSELNMSPQTRSAIDRILFFEPRTDIAKAIFIATPHRGASASRRIVGHIGALMIRRPQELHEARRELIESNPGRIKRSNFSIRGTDSVDELNPSSPSIAALQCTRFAPNVGLHCIIGTSNGIPGVRIGDGLVAIPSARLEAAQSTLEVAADHVEVHHQPESVAEIVRILLEHAPCAAPPPP